MELINSELDEARQAAERSPTDQRVMGTLASLLQKNGDFEQAEQVCRRWIELVPAGPGAHAGLVSCLAQQGRLDEAIEAVQRAIEIAPDHAQFQAQLGHLLLRKNDRRSAEQAYRFAIARAPDTPTFHSALAHCLSQQGRVGEAVSSAQRAVEINPDNFHFKLQLANLLLLGGDLSGAEQAFRRAIALAPDVPAAHAGLGSCLTKQGREGEAVAAVQRAIEIAPDNAHYRNQLRALSIPDRDLYRPLFSPWLGSGEFREVYQRAAPRSLVDPTRCYVLYALAKQALHLGGEYWECGVYKGGTAAMIAEILSRYNGPQLRLFDTFAGMPETDTSRDLHKAGDFADTSLNAVRQHVGHERLVSYHEGFIPDTFGGLEGSSIAFAHVDVDIYQSVLDCCEFIFPRLMQGGFMVFDDYGFPSCPGARAAVDGFFQGTSAFPLVLSTGQAAVFKSLG